jgi:hypothetical protein
MMVSKVSSIVTMALALFHMAAGFAPSQQQVNRPTSVVAAPSASLTALRMANDDDLLRWAKTSRSAAAGDNLVELIRPIGVILAEDAKGNVFVETLAPKGNAARSGKVIDSLPSLYVCTIPNRETELIIYYLACTRYFAML